MARPRPSHLTKFPLTTSSFDKLGLGTAPHLRGGEEPEF